MYPFIFFYSKIKNIFQQNSEVEKQITSIIEEEEEDKDVKIALSFGFNHEDFDEFE